FRAFRDFLEEKEGHFRKGERRDAKVLADAFNNRVDYIASFDKKAKNAWNRIRKQHEEKIRELVEAAGVDYRPIEILSPREFMRRQDDAPCG
ncbi:unnamed protein product, partial [marine sediment metagenome]